VKVAFDTSVLVAAVVEEHRHHARAVWWFHANRDFERVASWHSYCEAWAVLTAIPIEPRVTGEVARAVLDRLRTLVKFIIPRATTYLRATERCSARALRSGAVYDSLHLVTAEIEKADLLLTFNEKDFLRLAEPGDLRIAVPPDPPGPA
jgi:predicted nucleic acid-binding protein